MNCPNCNHPIAIGAAFCSECGASVESKKAFTTRKRKNISTVIKEKIKSPLFLVYTVFMSLTALFFAINIASGGVISALISIAGAVCTAIPAVKGWMMYFSDESISVSSVKSINVHNIAMIALTSLACIFSGLVAFLVVIVCLLGGFLLSTIGEAENVISQAIDMVGLSSRISMDDILNVFKNGGVVIAIAGFAFAAVVLFVTINMVLLYKNNNIHVEKIASAFENDKYEAKKYPLIRPWVFGIAFAILGVLSFASSFIIALILISLAGTLITSNLWFAAIHSDRNSTESVESTEEIITDAPSVKVKKVKEPKIKKSKAEEPKVEEVEVKEPEVETPVVEEPKAEEPKVEEPKTETPEAEEIETSEPASESADENTETEEVEDEAETSEEETEAEPVGEEPASEQEENGDPKAESAEEEPNTEVQPEEISEENAETSDSEAQN